MSFSDPKQLFRLSSVVLGSLAAFCGVIYLFGLGVVHLLNSVQTDIGKTLIAASVTVFVAVITLVLGKLLEQRLKIRDEIRAKKIPIYEKHIQTFFKIFFAPKLGGRQLDQKEIVASFATFAEQMITWGSSDVIKTWNDFRVHSDTGTDQQKIDRLEGIFRAIRKDVGNPVRDLPKGELLRLFVNDSTANSSNAKAAPRA